MMTQDKNITFFAGNDAYAINVNTLDTYVYCRMCIESELGNCRSLLDIGNGGFFNYGIEHIDHVVALDLFINEKAEYARNVCPVKGNVLDFNIGEKFDIIVLQMLIHHVTGNSPEQAVQNIETILINCANHLTEGGKIIIIESTVPSWFYTIEKVLFRLLHRVWNFSHPIVLQHTSSVLIKSSRKAALVLKEYTHIPKGTWVLQFGIKFPSLFTPVQPIKLVLSNPIH